jgi:hypothetical protein
VKRILELTIAISLALPAQQASRQVRFEEASIKPGDSGRRD